MKRLFSSETQQAKVGLSHCNCNLYVWSRSGIMISDWSTGKDYTWRGEEWLVCQGNVILQLISGSTPDHANIARILNLWRQTRFRRFQSIHIFHRRTRKQGQYSTSQDTRDNSKKQNAQVVFGYILSAAILELLNLVNVFLLHGGGQRASWGEYFSRYASMQYVICVLLLATFDLFGFEDYAKSGELLVESQELNTHGRRVLREFGPMSLGTWSTRRQPQT